MKAPIIESTSYRMRPFTDSDVSLWHVWDLDPEVQVHLPEPQNEPRTREAQLEYIRACDAEADSYYWSIETTDGVTIGTVALTDIDKHHRVAELGIVIGDKHCWGKGVATEVITTIVQYAFSDLGIARINAEAEADNVGIHKALAAADFSQDGLFKSARVKNGGRIDVLHFSVIKA